MADKKSEEAQVEQGLQVVAQLPVTPYDSYVAEDGKTIKLMTADAALTELVLTIRELKKGLL